MSRKGLIDKTILGVPDMDKYTDKVLLCEAQLNHAIPIIVKIIFDDLRFLIHAKTGVDSSSKRFTSNIRIPLIELMNELDQFKGRYLS